MKISVLALMLGLANAPAFGQEPLSSYTDLDLTQCTVIESDDFNSVWACSGLKGMPVMVRQSELRMHVSFGLTSTTEKAAKQTIPPRNELAPAIEWRVSNDEGYFKPFAAIVGYSFEREGEDEPGQVLTVIKIAPGATCQVAFIDMEAEPQAADLARKTADETARDFDCADEPKPVGTFSAF
ncbi:hypothetical protein [Devosia sp.]|uniref:hypothetical protein n=1 Tax=Devosia sp. TaxID=1871048 RepID=UPI003A8D3018